MIVVKVGGSLYDHPQLGVGLRTFLETLPSPVLLVPGGGPFADAVRQLDAIHRLGEEASHWLALRSLDAAAEFLKRLTHAQVLDAFEFCRSDDVLPHSWAVTSDSIAARAAVVHQAERLILLKSIDVPPNTPWPVAAMNGWVDAHFPHIMADASFPVSVVNFRRHLEQPSRPA